VASRKKSFSSTIMIAYPNSLIILRLAHFTLDGNKYEIAHI